MTKSKGIGRGGPRPNSGRPRKVRPQAAKTALPSKVHAPAEKAPASAALPLAAQPDADLDDLVKTAYQTLKSIMDNTALETAPRVSAARAVIAEAARRAGDGKGGKKGERAEAAKALSVGRFATPAPPRLVVDNK